MFGPNTSPLAFPHAPTSLSARTSRPSPHTRMEVPTIKVDASKQHERPTMCTLTDVQVERLRQRIYSAGSKEEGGETTLRDRAQTACSALLDQLCHHYIVDYLAVPKDAICSALDKCASSTKTTDDASTPPVTRCVSKVDEIMVDSIDSEAQQLSEKGSTTIVTEDGTTTSVTEEVSAVATAADHVLAAESVEATATVTDAATPASMASRQAAVVPPQVPSSARFLAALTPDQRVAIDKARAVFLDAGGMVDPCTDVFLARFCIGNKWNVAKTEAHLRRTLAWRASTNANKYRAAAAAGKTLLEFEEVQRFLSVATGLQQMGTTYAGDAVDYITVGNISAKRFLNELDNQCYYEGNLQISELQYYHFDRLTLLRGDGKLVKMFSVFDLDGLRMEHISFRMQARLKTTAPLHDLYYPEIMATACLINVPSFFANFWMLFGRVFSKEKRDAVQIHAKGKANLTKSIPQSWVPACYGGDLRQLPPQTMHALGFDTLPDAMLPQLLPGPTKWLGHFILPEADARALAAAEN